jgi:hypothetical protein
MVLQDICIVRLLGYQSSHSFVKAARGNCNLSEPLEVVHSLLDVAAIPHASSSVIERK